LEFIGNLRKRDFSGQDLAGAIFRDADLLQARFSGARLNRAVFAGCFAAEAVFDQSDCTNLQATGSNFYRSSFRAANLTDSLFWDCVLAGADLREATLKRITLTLDCNSFEELRLSRTASAKLAYLFSRARTPHRQKWLDVIGDHDLVLLDRLFKR
jgi:uncharacterized protein YjbI with pentapeptide repeats